FGLSTGAATAVLLTGCGPSPASPAPAAPPPSPAAPPDPAPTAPATEPPPEAEAATSERRVTIKTPDGEAEAFFVAKAGKHPGVIVWPDVAGLREAYEKMAKRLAGEGYAVLVVNPYYRSSKLPILQTFAE